MTNVEIKDDLLNIHIVGIDKLWSLKSSLEIPLAHITGVDRAQEEAKSWYKGIKLGATNLPGVISAGTFYHNKGIVFWDVEHPDKAIAINLKDERYKKIIIEVEFPEETIQLIKSNI